MERTFLIEPRDPAIFRDGKPFGLGLPARSMPWPLPSVVIGAIRTRLGRRTAYDAATVERLKRIEHVGPFLATRGEGGYTLAFAAPADAAAFSPADGGLELCPLRPVEHLPEGDGTDLPKGLWLVAGGRDQKPAEAPPFWRTAATIAWLAERGCQPVSRSEDELGWKGLARQRRIHLEVERATQAAKKGMLFATEGLEFADRGAERGICSRIRCGDGEEWAELEPMAPLGGERRLAYWSEVEVEWPAAPRWLEGEELVRLQLVTPGYFAEGWRPGWLAPGGTGCVVPDLEGLELSLVAAVVRRAVVQSGWDLTKPGGRSQKKTRFLAPAGSVYFCRVTKGDARRLWMRSICDDEQARRDGFGLVLCGVWQWRQD